MWCHDPDGAFDARCENLGCEDSCEDNSNCPLVVKDRKTYIMVGRHYEEKILETEDIVIELSEDKKSFKVIKHRYLNASKEYHISQLKHILTAGIE